MKKDLSTALRRVREALEPLRGRVPAAARALDLLERDLLPRTAGGDTYLVTGIVGPNNSGKSALFNSLVGRELSPSVPSGGATRRLIGAAHPELLATLRAEPTLARFRLRPLGEGAAAADEALRPCADPAELLVASEPGLPAALLLIDTPDFDSILEDNRMASESLLAVADLVIAVVTRHSYQNRAVVRFLERWFDHGRPWMLVYNEAIDEQVAREHTVKLGADVGTPPWATFWALHSMAVQRHEAPLVAQGLAGEGNRGLTAAPGSGARPGSGGGLRELLFDLDQVAEVKSRAFDAALARLKDALTEAAAALCAAAEQASAVLAAADACAFDVGVRVAAAAMPAGPFVSAFRAVLDRRSNPLSRRWRTALRQLRIRMESLPALLRGQRSQSEAAAGDSLGDIEGDELRKMWPSFWEEVVRDLGREGRHVARRSAGKVVAELLDADLVDGRRDEARQRAERALAASPADIDEFEYACQQLVEKAIAERGFDLDIQAAADIATLLPLALAAAVIVNTGGLGSDIAVAGGGAVSAFLIEKYAHLLGGGIMAEARRRWTELRGRQLALVLIEAALPHVVPELRGRTQRDVELADRLRGLAGEL